MAWFTSFSPVNMGNALFGDLENDQLFGRASFGHVSSKLIDYNYTSGARDYIFRGDFNFLGSTTADAEITSGNFRSLTLATSNIVSWTLTNVNISMLDALDRASHLDPVGDTGSNFGINTYLMSASDRIDDQSAGGSVLNGYAGNDTILGGVGNDTLDGGAGQDSMDGGAGSDTFFVDSASDTVVDTSGGIDTVNSLVSFVLPEGTENLLLLGTGSTSGKGNTGANTITGNDGNNLLLGRGASDSIDGGNGDDTLEGGLGLDTLNGGAGSNTASYYHAAKGITVSIPAGGNGTIAGQGTDTVTNIENVIGTQFDDSITGNADANVIDGAAGDDTLDGAGTLSDFASYAMAAKAVNVSLALLGSPQDTQGAGTDTLLRIEGLIGSKFNDTLAGGAGNDMLDGGSAGNDSLTGGAGTDQFIFSMAPGNGIDTIGDFTVGTDQIVLSSLILPLDVDDPGIVLPNEFVSGNIFQASSPEQHLIFNTSNGALYYDRDGSDFNFNPIQIAFVYSAGTTPAATLSAADFTIG